ncbi:MAG: hypothetical protein ACXWC6_01170 [Ramlibacter sp.]
MRLLHGIAGIGISALAACALHAQPRATAVARAGDAVVFDGRIDAASVAQALELLKDPAVMRLVITSGGGQVDAAIDLAWAMHARQLDVEVPAACLSSCANYVLPAARRKLLGRPGAVAWHGNMAHVLHLVQTGQGTWSGPEVDDARRLARREAALYASLGVDGFVCWFAKLPPYAVDEFDTLAPADMERFGIRGVTVRDPAAAVANPLVQAVQVDWAALEALRPAARLEP